MEGIGFLSYYGFSPMIDYFRDAPSHQDPALDEKEINVLVSDSGDLRHTLKSLMDLSEKVKTGRKFKLNVRFLTL
jgi:hypothetical protein